MAGPKSDKFWSDAVRLAAFRECESDPEKRRYINIIASNLVRMAMDGDMAAIKEIGERIDGKAPQAMTMAAPDGGPVQIEITARERLAEFLASRSVAKPG